MKEKKHERRFLVAKAAKSGTNTKAQATPHKQAESKRQRAATRAAQATAKNLSHQAAKQLGISRAAHCRQSAHWPLAELGAWAPAPPGARPFRAWQCGAWR